MRYRDYADRADLVICGDCSTRATLCVIDRDKTGEHDTQHAYDDLRGAWEDAKAAHDTLDTPGSGELEQATYDALIDFVEENGLNYTQRDPRGPLSDASKTKGWIGPDARLSP